jgi:hypothetical protein
VTTSEGMAALRRIVLFAPQDHVDVFTDERSIRQGHWRFHIDSDGYQRSARPNWRS